MRFSFKGECVRVKGSDDDDESGEQWACSVTSLMCNRFSVQSTEHDGDRRQTLSYPSVNNVVFSKAVFK